MKLISNIFYFAKRELFKIFKDSNLLMVFLVAPLAYPAIYGSLYINKCEEKVPIAVCDMDNSSESRGLLRDIDALQNIDIIYNAGSSLEMEELLNNSKVQGALLIPKDFSKKLKRGETNWLPLKVNPGRLIVLGDVGLPISQAANSYGAKIAKEVLQNRGVPAISNIDFYAPVNFTFNTMFNPFVAYGEMMLPAIMAIVLSQLTFVGTAASQAKEHSGGWKDMLSSKKHPFANFSIGIGKLIAISAIFTLFSIVLKYTLIPLYQIHLETSNSNLFIIAIVGVIASAAFGLFIGTFFKYKITTFVVLGFTSYPFFMSAGYAWPIEQLPDSVKIISQALPTTNFLQALFKTSQMELPLSYSYNNLIILGVLTLLYLVLFQIRLIFIKRKIEKAELAAINN